QPIGEAFGVRFPRAGNRPLAYTFAVVTGIPPGIDPPDIEIDPQGAERINIAQLVFLGCCGMFLAIADAASGNDRWYRLAVGLGLDMRQIPTSPEVDGAGFVSIPEEQGD